MDTHCNDWWPLLLSFCYSIPTFSISFFSSTMKWADFLFHSSCRCLFPVQVFWSLLDFFPCISELVVLLSHHDVFSQMIWYSQWSTYIPLFNFHSSFNFSWKDLLAFVVPSPSIKPHSFSAISGLILFRFFFIMIVISILVTWLIKLVILRVSHSVQ